MYSESRKQFQNSDINNVNVFHKVLPLLLPNNLEEIVASLEEKYKAFLNLNAVLNILYRSLFNFLLQERRHAVWQN